MWDAAQPVNKNVNDVNRVLIARLRAKREEAELNDRLVLIEEYGNDVYDEGTVLRFKKQFRAEKIAYTYAALKAGGRWYVTGLQFNYALTWDELIVCLTSDPYPIHASSVEQLYTIDEIAAMNVKVVDK